MKTINKIRAVLDKTVPYIAVIFFLVCVVSTVYGTINRTLGLKISASWVEEVSIFSMIWATCLLIGHLLRKGMHTQFTLILERIHGKANDLWQIMILLIETGVFMILLIGGIQLTVNGSKMFLTALPITRFWVYMSVPVGAALSILELIMLLAEKIVGLKDGRVVERRDEA